MSGGPTTPRPQLSLVVPVASEAVVGGVLSAWAADLERLGLDYELLVCDDGSDDETPHVLRQLAAAGARGARPRG